MIRKLFPSREQWSAWSLPSKLTAIGVLLAVVSLSFWTVEKVFDISDWLLSNGQDIQSNTFALADCNFDAVFEFPPDGFEKYRRAFPGEAGTLSVILHIYPNESQGQYARLQLTGRWQGTSGMIPIYQEDLVIFTLSARQFTLIHKKPIVEHVPGTMRHLSVNSHYQVQLTAVPGFAVPLVPKYLSVRTHEGIVYPISEFTGPRDGWYFAAFSP